ncbi:MAG: diadenylate cyclase CdaA [Flavobacteriaceae bacterium]
MNTFDFLDLSFVDIFDIILVALLLFYLYKLVRGTVAINIFIGIVIIYIIWKLTAALKMDMLSSILGNFISVGFFALIVVFQQEIRKFLLLIGSTNFTNRRGVIRYFNFLKEKQNTSLLQLDILVADCKQMAKNKTGALIVIEQSNNLNFLILAENEVQLELAPQMLETLFFKNGPMHDGAIILRNNKIIATRVILPVSQKEKLPKKYGLRHRAGLGISEKTDALVVVISEQRGSITYIKNGRMMDMPSSGALSKQLQEDFNS